jgi:outer membrane protein TolC
MPIRRSIVTLLVAAVTASSLEAQSAMDTLRLSIADAVAVALRNSDESRLAALGVTIAEAQLTQARATALPQVSLNGQYSQVVRNARAEIVGNIFGQAFNYSSNLSVTQPLFQGGRELYAWRGASRVRSAARLDVAETRAALEVDVQRLYLNALFAMQLASIQSNGLTLARSRVQQVEQLEAGGRAARYDVLRARVEAANLEPVALQAANDRAIAELELRRLLNIPVDRPVILTSALDATSATAVITVANEQGLDARPDRALVQAAEFALAARRDAVGIARAEFLPTVSVFLRTGFLALPTSAGIPNAWGVTSADLCPPGSAPTRVCQNNGWFRDETFGVQVSWPLFAGFRAKGGLDLASAQARVAEVQLQQRREQVAVEVARAQAEFARARAAFEARRTNVSEATEAFQLASLRFERGIGTQLETSDAQLAFLTAQANEARAVYDLHLAFAELARAQGRPIPVPAIPGSLARPSTSNGQ